MRATGEVAEEVASVVLWKTEPESEASREIKALTSDGLGLITENSVRTAYSAAQMGVHVCVQHARAASEIVKLDISPMSLEVLARATIDVAAATWWMTEERIGARRRVCRLQLLRINSAMELKKVTDQSGVTNDDGKYGESEADVINYSQQLGIAPFHNAPGLGVNSGCEQDVRPSYTARARALLDSYGVPPVYAMYSGSTHGELWSVWRHFEEDQDSTDRTNPLRRLVPNDVAQYSAVNVLLLSMLSQIDAVGRLFGWKPESQQGKLWVPIRKMIPRVMTWRQLS